MKKQSKENNNIDYYKVFESFSVRKKQLDKKDKKYRNDSTYRALIRSTAPDLTEEELDFLEQISWRKNNQERKNSKSY